MKIGFFIIAFAILISINSYVILRGWQTLPSVSAIRPIYLVSMIVLFLTLMVTIIFGEHMTHDIAKVISFIGFTYFIVFVYLLISFLLVDGVRIANYFFRFFSNWRA